MNPKAGPALLGFVIFFIFYALGLPFGWALGLGIFVFISTLMAG